MKGDHIIQLDNQPLVSPRKLRGSRTRARNKSSNVSSPTIPSNRRQSTSSINDNKQTILPRTADSVLNSSDDTGYSSSSMSAGEQQMVILESDIPFQQGLDASPVRKRRTSSGTLQRSWSQRGKSPRYKSTRRRSLPVIFEQDDPAILAPSSSSATPHRRKSKTKLQRRPTSVSDAVIGTSYSYPVIRKKGSSILQDRHGIKKRSSTLADSYVAAGGVGLIPLTTPANGSTNRRTSEVYSVIPRKSNLPRYGFIIQRNPCTPPLQRRRSNVIMSGYPHQVRRPSTITIDEINKRLIQAKLERKDSKVKFSVAEEVSSRRGSLRSNGLESVSQVADSVYSSSSCSSDSEESSSSAGTSSEWTTDSSYSGSDSDDSDTDSSYTTTSTSSSTSSSSDSDSSSDYSSSDAEGTSMSGSTATSETDTSGIMTGRSSSPSTPKGMDESLNESETSSRTRSSKRSEGSLSRSSSLKSSRTSPETDRIRKSSSSSRSSTRSSSFRSSSSSPIKSRRKSRSTSVSSASHASQSLECSSPPPKHSHSRKNSVKSNKSRTRADYIDLDRDNVSKSLAKNDKLDRRKSNGYVSKDKGGHDTDGIVKDDGAISTPTVIVHRSTEDRLDVPSTPTNVSAACVIL